MSAENNLLLCYNRGCGKKFDPNDNKSDGCIHHPGTPVFHDAYKGWSCCNKKCIDFTEFLNIKGCTKSCHSNVKPESEKPVVNELKTNDVVEYKAPLKNIKAMKRPSFNSPQILMNPIISPRLVEQLENLNLSDTIDKSNKNVIKIGESCKNKSCKATYKGNKSDMEECIYHPGAPIFHEGLKYWSCCQKKTTDFSVFLQQIGCTKGVHLWIDQDSNKKIQCRMDWHQTGNHVVVSIFAKNYHPNESSVKLNAIRLTVDLFFPQEKSSYNLDLELKGIVDVDKSTVKMLPTKVEIELRKAEPGTWTKLNFSRSTELIESEIKSDDKSNDMIDQI